MRTAIASFSIGNGASLSDAVRLSGSTPTEIVMPGAWTAAGITFQISHDGTTYQDMYRSGAEVAVTVDAAQNVRLDPGDFIGINYIKLRSGTSGTPVNQGAARTINVMLLDEYL